MEVKGYAFATKNIVVSEDTYGGKHGKYAKQSDAKTYSGLGSVKCLVLTGEEMEWYLANKPKGEK